MCASLFVSVLSPDSIGALSRGPTFAPYLASVATIFAPVSAGCAPLGAAPFKA